MRTDKEWMREDTWHFGVEVLRVYGRQELWSHGFGARPVSDGPYQPVDAADVRRRVAFGARQDNEFADRHCCVHRSRWSVVSGARVPRGTSKPLVTTSSASEREEAVRPHKSKFPRRSFSRERSPTSTGGPRACYRRRGKLSDGGSSLSTLVGTASSASALEVRGLLRSIGRNKLFSHPPIPGFVTGNWLYLALPCWIALSWKWISFQLTCFTLLVTGRNPFGGTLGNNGDRSGQHRGELCWPVPSSWAPSLLACLVLGPLPLVGPTVGLQGVVRLSATVRLHALVGKKDGHTFAPNE
ncbi:hypothetical protein THAOC_28045 [Thalassiosira oceanica]|uniref:DUF6743 domain-containing protein n=1 Tax=Thalassiosira oceanica TaxID=159749 RepID=K0RK76_THAOC|nr:hypothetical protein THAOC_28045 [Thalassiosira oceanica]|eukprot:EJK52659.1 hypothetical protein THAOC_28045 [Thalassiosira oceanica]